MTLLLKKTNKVNFLLHKVNKFKTTTLAEMDGVKLMNRSDTKFAFKIDKLPILLDRMQPFYKILLINGELVHKYKSLYYDTDNKKFYFDHHNDRVNRNKVRFREYVGSNVVFLEVKRKTNKRKTIKKRIKVDSITDKLTKEQEQFVNKLIGKELDLSAQHWINFSRLTFVHNKNKERLTVDLNLNFNNDESFGDLNDIVIAEVKQERMSRSLSDFMKIAKELHILPIRISKYCMSTISLNPDLKYNRFKQKMLFINKLKKI